MKNVNDQHCNQDFHFDIVFHFQCSTSCIHYNDESHSHLHQNDHAPTNMHCKWFANGASPKWTLCGLHPRAWVIFSAVMLHPHLVGVVAGSHHNLLIPPHFHHDLHHVCKLWFSAMTDAWEPPCLSASWFPLPKRKPPDPMNTMTSVPEDPEEPINAHHFNQTDIVCSVSRHKTSASKRGASVDRGANGGLAGSDVRALHKTDQQVDVEGIDNHQLINIPIVTAAGVVESQHGPVVLIMNQHAHMPNGKTIHSSAQLEAHGVTVDDHAMPNGGHQCVITQGGHVMPLQVRSSLVCMDMRPPTDAELKPHGKGGLPQIILTSNVDWVPSSVDHEHDSEQWFDAMENLPDLNNDSPFDEDGECQCVHDIDTNAAIIESSFDISNELLINSGNVIEATCEPHHCKPSTCTNIVIPTAVDLHQCCHL